MVAVIRVVAASTAARERAPESVCDSIGADRQTSACKSVTGSVSYYYFRYIYRFDSSKPRPAAITNNKMMNLSCFSIKENDT